MATDTTRPLTSAARSGPIAVAVVLIVAAAGLITGLGHLRVVAIGVAVIVVGTGTLLVARRSFAWFISAALVIRPVADLTATEGIGIPELIGVGTLLICVGWLVIHESSSSPASVSP